MKSQLKLSPNHNVRVKIPAVRRRAYWSAIWAASLACGSAAVAQNTPAPVASPASGSATNAVSEAVTNVTKLGETTVVGQLDAQRSTILPDLGATVYTISKDRIDTLPLGQNAAFNQILLATPGMAEDGLGQVHLRGEHANLQYRINDVLMPEGITGFGSELDTRFVESMRLITGSLPAEYGFRTAGVIDLQTKNGAFDQGGSVTMYGGTYDTLAPSFEIGGSQGKLNYFVDGSYNHNGIGVENPTASSVPLHDTTDQYKSFMYLSYLMDETSRLTAMGSLSYSDFQIPIDPAAQRQGDQPTSGLPWVPGTYLPRDVNDNQNEQNYYGVVAYQKSAGDFNLQLAGYGRKSGAHYTPDAIDPTLYFNNGVATDENRVLYSGGFQGDASYALGDKHTIRAGLSALDESVSAHAATTVLQTDPVSGDSTGLEETIHQNSVSHGQFYGFYLQDECKLIPKLTLNYGARFDVFASSFDHENQLSPRANLVYEVTEKTTLHGGYSRYFTPPPLENIPQGDLLAFNGTSGASSFTPDSSVRAERANYYDLGITQEIIPGLKVGVDGYYKTAHNQLDDGYFGQSLILSAFNYTEGRIFGIEVTPSYTIGGFTTYANIAYAEAQGRGAASAQYLWGDPTTYNYVQNNWIYLDHDQRITGSFGVSYLFKESRGSTRIFANALYGSGLRTDGDLIPGPNPDGAVIPNGSSVPAYSTVGLGIEQAFKLGTKESLRARLDVLNITDNSYYLRDGSGVGVNAAQYGERRGIFGTLTFAF